MSLMGHSRRFGAALRTSACHPNPDVAFLASLAGDRRQNALCPPPVESRVAIGGRAATPGAALTYARRYALFTLVGIAGEDDLDAPDLDCQPLKEANVSASSADRPDRPASTPVGRQSGRGNGGEAGRPTLDPGTSAEARDRLLREIVELPSNEAAGEWA